MERLLRSLPLALCAAAFLQVNCAAAPVSAATMTLPLSFEPNRGQAPAGVDYVARSRGGCAAMLSANALTLAVLPRRVEGPLERFTPAGGGGQSQETSATGAVFRVELIGASADARMEAFDPLPGRINYLIGDDCGAWRTDIPTYGRVECGEVWPGIGAVYYGNERQLEYDFNLAPGTRPEAVRMRILGADSLEPDAEGNLLVRCGLVSLVMRKPAAYQPLPGAPISTQDAGFYQSPARREVEVCYSLSADYEVSFCVGAYDSTKPLVIDPVFTYSSYLGGSGDDEAHAVAVDASGNIYIAGRTTGDFPVTAGAYQRTYKDNTDAFVSKINPGKSAAASLVYSTYLGGSGFDEANGIAVDINGAAYVAGKTGSSNFPMSKMFGAGGGYDIFITKLNSSGSNLVYSVRMGGSMDDSAAALALDASLNAYIAGSTLSPDFPTQSAARGYYSGNSDAIVAKINGSGSTLRYSTYLGGSFIDYGYGIAVDGDGSAIVTGSTSSSDFPTKSAFQSIYAGGSSDAFVTKLKSDGTNWVFSTFMGGSTASTGGAAADIGVGVAADSQKNIFVTGYTSSLNFPMEKAIQPYFGGGVFDAFMLKFNSSGSTLFWSSYLGGKGDDVALGAAVDKLSNYYVTGETYSPDFPVINALQDTYDCCGDGFAAKINPGGTLLMYSTYFGGGGQDISYGIATDSSGNAAVAGVTTSPDFPVTDNAYSQVFGGGLTDAFAARISPAVRVAQDDIFTSGNIQPPGSLTGWSVLGFNVPGFAAADYNSTAKAFRGWVAYDPSLYRITGWMCNMSDWLKYVYIGPEKYVRVKYYIYTSGTTAPTGANAIPNMRMRASTRFAVNSMLEVFNHLNVDLTSQIYYQELKPSSDSTKPSLYRVDFDPVDVPFLMNNAGTEGVLRAFETYAIDPQDNGYIGMTESSIGVYPSWMIDDTGTPAKVFAPTASDAGNLKVYTPTELDCYDLILSSTMGVFAVRDMSTTTPLPAYSEGPWGITMDSALVPANRVGVVSREFNPGASETAPGWLRVEEGRQYKIRWHITSTQMSNQNSGLTLRGRSIKFGWSQKYELSGAWSTGGSVPGANATICQQALPGIGCQNPDKEGAENGGWYTMLMHTPMSIDIRPEYAGPLVNRMPNICAQPGPMQPGYSRRDIRFGCDLIDTLSVGVNKDLERGNFTIDRIIVRIYNLVDD